VTVGQAALATTAAALVVFIGIVLIVDAVSPPVTVHRRKESGKLQNP